MKYSKLMRNVMAGTMAVGAYLAPMKQSDGATIISGYSQGNSSAEINYNITNNDNGAIYDSGSTLDLSKSLDVISAGASASLLDTIVANNASFSDKASVYNALNINIEPNPTGDVNDGWSHSLDSSTGVVTLNNDGIVPDGTYETWQNSTSNSNQDEMAITVDFGNMFDFNNNGTLDTNEQIYKTAQTQPNGFVGYGNIDNQYPANIDVYNVIPEPNSAVLVGAGLAGLLALRRRRK